MTERFAAELEERLVRYVTIDTQSDEDSMSAPSTDIQFDLLRLLHEELTGIGVSDVRLTDYGTVLATVPGTADGAAPVIGLLAHVDTAPAYHADGVRPVVHRNYDGGDIHYDDAPDLVLSPDRSAYLGGKTGETIVTASGTTLLGADDKAGVAIIMTLARHLLNNQTIPHGPIRIAFTPDEEIGRGVHPDLAGDLAADFAYTLDGAEKGVVEYESFSADRARVSITGVSAHPGNAKGVLVNALQIAAKIISTLPQSTMTPETTSGREGFIFVGDLAGNAAEAEIKLILRDFELDGLAAKGALLRQVCATVQATEPRAAINCEISPQYRNMRYWLEKDMTPVNLALAACKAAGLEPRSSLIRGGTDGSRLTEFGIPTPNIFTGMQDIHGPLEWISVQDMAAATEVCLKLVQLAAATPA